MELKHSILRNTKTAPMPKQVSSREHVECQKSNLILLQQQVCVWAFVEKTLTSTVIVITNSAEFYF